MGQHELCVLSCQGKFRRAGCAQVWQCLCPILHGESSVAQQYIRIMAKRHKTIKIIGVPGVNQAASRGSELDEICGRRMPSGQCFDHKGPHLSELRQIVQAVKKYKQKHNLPPKDALRETEIMKRIRVIAKELELDPALAEAIMQELLKLSQ